MSAAEDERDAYRWGPTFKIEARFQKTPETAATVKAELDRLRGNQETLTADEVVEAARAPTSPLHAALTWDDGEAAERWRREQARELIRAVRMVTVLRIGGEAVRSAPVPVYASYRPEGQDRAYREVYVAMGDEAHAKALLREALAELNGFRRRYAALAQLAGLFREIDDLLGKPPG